ncbi:hypothetical protein H0H81_006082 [Sphagnurus paluster]|uniref:HMG box domain-containing protein n=1 Tax=Sphagnurus paluster TaxID=117069 RepID=A0A9P7K6S3_9AGAR|nr:hypothetical protein H0H81_006082 [Sphagnurus paluster]
MQGGRWFVEDDEGFIIIPTMSNIRGWQPDEVQTHNGLPPLAEAVRPDPIGVYNFQSVVPNTIDRRGSSPSSPTSSNSSLGGFQSDPFNEPPARRGDPAWIARPRNPFIIFRCEYSREHTKEGKRVRRPPGSQTEKTLSKRAAEAWHQLSPAEKNHYKERAEAEKEEHARRHPNYRFRPMKRNAAKKTGSVSRSNSQQMTSMPSEEKLPTMPSPHQSEPPLTAPPPPPPPPPLDNASIKARRRRSASVPSLPMGLYPLIHDHNLWSGEPRLEMKRSRSVMANRPQPIPFRTPGSGYESPSFDPRQLEVSIVIHGILITNTNQYVWQSHPSSGYYTPEEVFGTLQPASRGAFGFSGNFSAPGSPAILPSPLSQVSSPLAWMGDIPSNDSSPWASSPSIEMQGLSLQSSYPDFVGVEPIAPETFSTYPGNSDWDPATSYPLTMSAVNDLENPGGALFSPAVGYTDAPRVSYDLPPPYTSLDNHSAGQSQELMFPPDMEYLLP